MTKQRKLYLRNYGREYRKTHDREKYISEWRKKNPNRIKVFRRHGNLKYKYGITFAQYHQLYRQQKGRCAICNVFKPLYHRKSRGKGAHDILCVDHNHTDNQIRSLLCGLCNKGLGHFKDSPALLQSASHYLMKFVPRATSKQTKK